MNHLRLRHDCAWAAALELLETVAPALREEEYRDFFGEAFRICLELLEGFEEKAARERKRLAKRDGDG